MVHIFLAEGALWYKMQICRHISSDSLCKKLYGKFMLFFLHFVVHKPNPALHFVALVLWNILHFVEEPTWARQIMAYKVWARVH